MSRSSRALGPKIQGPVNSRRVADRSPAQDDVHAPKETIVESSARPGLARVGELPLAVALSALLVWTAQFHHFRDFGLYEDDYWFISQAMGKDPAYLLGRHHDAADPRLAEQIRAALQYVLGQQIRADSDFDVVGQGNGAVPGTPIDRNIRIDYVQHVCSAMIRASEWIDGAP